MANAGTAADAAEAEANQRIAAARGSVADAEARAGEAIDVARSRTRDEVVAAERAAAEATAVIVARREKAEAEAATTEQRLTELRGQVGAAQQQLDAIRARIETLRTSFAA